MLRKERYLQKLLRVSNPPLFSSSRWIVPETVNRMKNLRIRQHVSMLNLIMIYKVVFRFTNREIFVTSTRLAAK